MNGGSSGSVGDIVGLAVGFTVCAEVGDTVGDNVTMAVGCNVGSDVGLSEGHPARPSARHNVYDSEGSAPSHSGPGLLVVQQWLHCCHLLMHFALCSSEQHGFLLLKNPLDSDLEHSLSIHLHFEFDVSLI